MEKKELAVAALKNGTVIDHIPASALFTCVELLGISEMTGNVTIGNNLPSARLGKKGIIKVADTVFPPEVISRIAIIAPSAVINVIENFEVVSKEPVVLPKEVVGLVECCNPKCITRHQPIPTRFEVIDPEKPLLRCHYCEHEQEGDKIKFNS